MKKHYLKIWPEYFDAVRTGKKTFEVRKYDRHFVLGDILILHEYDPETKRYARNIIKVKITYICKIPMLDNIVGMSIKVIE